MTLEQTPKQIVRKHQFADGSASLPAGLEVGVGFRFRVHGIEGRRTSIEEFDCDSRRYRDTSLGHPAIRPAKD